MPGSWVRSTPPHRTYRGERISKRGSFRAGCDRGLAVCLELPELGLDLVVAGPDLLVVDVVELDRRAQREAVLRLVVPGERGGVGAPATPLPVSVLAAPERRSVGAAAGKSAGHTLESDTATVRGCGGQAVSTRPASGRGIMVHGRAAPEPQAVGSASSALASAKVLPHRSEQADVRSRSAVLRSKPKLRPVRSFRAIPGGNSRVLPPLIAPRLGLRVLD